MTVESSETMNQCPGCGKTVDPLRAPAVSVVEGRIAHFCSGDCRERYLNRMPTTPPKAAPPAPERSPRADDDTGRVSDPFPVPASEVQTVLLQSKLLRPELITTVVLLTIALVVVFLPGKFDGLLPPLVTAVAVLGRLVWGIVKDRRSSPLRILEGAALPIAAASALVTTLLGTHPRLTAVAVALLIAVESIGRLFELIGRHRSGVLSAVDDNQQVALAASWRDNSALAAKIKQSAMFVEWARFPTALAAAILTYFVTSQSISDALFAFATVLVGMNPRILRMATGDAHLAAALMASKRGVVVRDAHAVDALAKTDIALFMANRTLVEGPSGVVDWTVLPQVNEQPLLDALLTVESNSIGPLAQVIAAFAGRGNARAAAASEVETVSGRGVIGTTAWGRLIAGERTLLLEHNILTGQLEKEAETIEASGRRAVFVSLDDKPAAVFGIEEPIVPKAEEAITALKVAGMETAFTTSAEVLPAQSLAHRIGIDTVFFGTEEESIGDALQKINGRGDQAVLIGNGPHFEEHLREAAAAIALGNTEKTQAGFDTTKSAIKLVPFLVSLTKRTDLSVKVNLLLGAGVIFASIGIAASWFSPMIVLSIGVLSAAASASTTFNAPYPLMTRLGRAIAAPFKAMRVFLKEKLGRRI